MLKNSLFEKLSKILILYLLFVSCNTEKLPGKIETPEYLPVIERLQDFILFQMQDKDLPAVSIALVDDQEIAWAQGFGFADPEKKIAATANTVYRVG